MEGEITTMKKLIVYYGEKPEYVEGFPKDCKRLCEGSLHLYPRKQMEVTDSEYEHMKSKYSWLMKKVRVVAELKSVGSKVDSKKKKSEAKAPESDSGVKAEPPGGKQSKKKVLSKKR